MKLRIMGLCLLLLFTSALAAADHPSQRTADDYYGMALQAYLLGDFDQAFSMDSKSLELDPGHRKAIALFSVLTLEKSWTPKTEIWIGGKSMVMPTSKDGGVTEKGRKLISPGPGLRKLQELESRIQIIALLNSIDSQEKFRALSVGQVQNGNRLEEIIGKSDDREAATQRRFGESEKGFGILYLLSLLACILSSAAFWVNWKTGKRLSERPLAPVIHLGESENVIKLHQG